MTENGSIKIETQINADMQREYLRKLYIISLVSLISGCIGLAAYIVWVVLVTGTEAREPSIMMLILFAVLFGFGLVFLLACKKTVKNTGKSGIKLESCEFFNNYIIAEDYLGGEKVATVKIYYRQIVKRRETKNFLFIFLRPGAAIPVSKAGLSEGELNALRKLVGLPVKGNTEIKLADGDEGGVDKAADENVPATAAEKELAGSEEQTENKEE